MTAVVADRFEFWSVLASEEDRDTQLVVGNDGPVLVAVDGDELSAALDVLIENVFSHTGRGTAFEVTVAPTRAGCVITVDDAGTGFDPALAAAGRSGADSTGLGLAIVERLARTTSGSVEISASPLGGARVRCQLGPARV